MSRLRRWLVAAITVAIVMTATVMAAAARARPVLLSISPDPTEVRPRNYCIMNPFRDRSPERAAERYLIALREGRTEVLVTLVDSHELPRILNAEQNWPVQKWRLGRRQDTATGTDLMYWVERGNGYSKRYQPEEVQFRVAGRGTTVRVVSYGAVY